MGSKYLPTAEEDVWITRDEPNFDRACDTAHSRAVALLGQHEANEAKYPGRYALEITFLTMRACGGMGGWSYEYKFHVRVIDDRLLARERGDDFEDEDDDDDETDAV